MPEDTIERIHAMLRARNHHVELHPGLLLGADGLGLDSIALVEVLLECEEAFGVAIATDLLAASPLTVGLLIDAVQAQVPE
jgi:acyl carrier protein